ncbi:MAG: TIGR03668 family PPOX class F420-dependent oxidoreductase [Deltaproteobacteria bacterium]|nr:TIGR03668 family PPOX class F420-dependent oxidoreductase [Deltaproteobacteria bacterium]
MPNVLSEPVRAFLDRSRVAHLATADRGGRPHVVPLCFARDQDRLYFVVDEKPKAPGKTLKRLRNIAENPAVALLVDRYDDADWTRLEYALVHGRAEVVGDAGEFARALGLLRARYPQYQKMRLEPERNALVRIVPSAVHHWRWR